MTGDQTTVNHCLAMGRVNNSGYNGPFGDPLQIYADRSPRDLGRSL
jgi:hypothetical protein